MRDGFRIIDCDRHVMEPADMWERYLERPFRHYVGWLVPATDTIGDRITDATWRGAFGYAISRGFDSQAYLDDLDREGIDVAVLFSTAGLGFCWYEDLTPECSAAPCRAYNNWRGISPRAGGSIPRPERSTTSTASAMTPRPCARYSGARTSTSPIRSRSRTRRSSRRSPETGVRARRAARATWG